MKIDWVRFCRNYGIKMSGKIRNNVWIECKCPFCHDNHTHGAINAKSGGYNCWKCGKHSMYEFVSIAVGVAAEKHDVFQALRPYFSDQLSTLYIPKDNEEQEGTQKVELGLRVPGTTPLGIGCRKYLEKRGLNADYVANKYKFKDGGIGGRWAYRLIIPVLFEHKAVCWQGRHIGNDKIRYLSSSLKEAADIKDYAYNLDNCKGDKVIVVEGVFDCLKLGDGCCSLFGISVKDKQLKLLADRYKEVYILFDSEPSAQESAEVCVNKLRSLGVDAYNVYVEGIDGKDPGDMTREEVIEVRKEILGDYSEETPWLIGD